MAWKFITPPPNRPPLPMKFFIADRGNHPGNTPGAMLVKEMSGDLSHSCCCNPCCCNYDDCGGTAPTPASLTASLITTGDCSCLPGSVALPQVGATCEWNSGLLTECGETFRITLSCDSGSPPTCPWIMAFVCDLPQNVTEIEEMSCNPLYIRFAPFTPVSGNCCTGTVQVTITE